MSHFEVVGELEWSKDPESYADSNDATGRASLLDRSKVMTQTKRDTPVLWSRGLGVQLATAQCKNYIAEKAQENHYGRCKQGRPKREEDNDIRMEVGSWNVRTMLQAGKMAEIAEEILTYDLDITALQMR